MATESKRETGEGKRKLRILVANDPRSYREAISGVLLVLRPVFEVVTVDPGTLDAEVERISPGMVLCSRLTQTISDKVPVWIELYPEGAGLARVKVGGSLSTVNEFEFRDLLSIIDQAAGSGW
jgi:hypothetical protein